jgi:RND family efflux transporter MFP subunit
MCFSFLPASVAAFAVSLGICSAPDQARPAGPPAPPPAVVTVAKPVQRVVTDSDEYVGRFVATDTVEIRSRVSGYLASIDFKDGQTVEKGQLLFTIDQRPYITARDQAKADLSRAAAQAEAASADLVRSERLIKDKNISEQVYEQRIAAKKQADADLESSRAAMRRAELDLEFTQLRAPVTGRIGDRQVSLGNLVTGGTQGNTTLLATIVALKPIYFEFSMDEAAYLRILRLYRSTSQPGQPAQSAVAVKLLDEDSFIHKGDVDFVDNVLDQSSGTIRMRARLPNSEDLLTPGMFGRVKIMASNPYEALLVPEAAVMSDQSRKILLTVNADNVVVPKVVTLGPVQDGMRVIASGIGKDDMIIVNGLMRARPGAKVNPQPPGAPPPGAPPAGAPGAPPPGQASSGQTGAGSAQAAPAARP